MSVVNEIIERIIANREIKREGLTAFRSKQRSMSSTKGYLKDVYHSMVDGENKTLTHREIVTPTYDSDANEIREIIVNEKGIFQKINYTSNIYKGQMYNMLFTDGAFAQVDVENDEIKSIISQDNYGIYRELQGFPKKTRDKLLQDIRWVIEEMSDLALPSQE